LVFACVQRLTPWSTVFPHKLKVPQLFKESKCEFPCSQEFASRLCPEPVESIPHPHIQFIRKLLYMLLSTTFPGVKRPEGEASQSPSSSSEVKNKRSDTSTPPYVCLVYFLVEHRTTLSFKSPPPPPFVIFVSLSYLPRFDHFYNITAKSSIQYLSQ
jgi:hypothetical protein